MGTQKDIQKAITKTKLVSKFPKPCLAIFAEILISAVRKYAFACNKTNILKNLWQRA